MKQAGVVDYLSWSQRLKLNDIPLLVKHCRVAGPVSRSALTELELELLHNMIGRLSRLAEVAAEVRSLQHPNNMASDGAMVHTT